MYAEMTNWQKDEEAKDFPWSRTITVHMDSSTKSEADAEQIFASVIDQLLDWYEISKNDSNRRAM